MAAGWAPVDRRAPQAIRTKASTRQHGARRGASSYYDRGSLWCGWLIFCTRAQPVRSLACAQPLQPLRRKHASLRLARARRKHRSTLRARRIFRAANGGRRDDGSVQPVPRRLDGVRREVLPSLRRLANVAGMRGRVLAGLFSLYRGSGRKRLPPRDVRRKQEQVRVARLQRLGARGRVRLGRRMSVELRELESTLAGRRLISRERGRRGLRDHAAVAVAARTFL